MHVLHVINVPMVIANSAPQTVLEHLNITENLSKKAMKTTAKIVISVENWATMYKGPIIL